MCHHKGNAGLFLELPRLQFLKMQREKRSERKQFSEIKVKGSNVSTNSIVRSMKDSDWCRQQPVAWSDYKVYFIGASKMIQ